MSTLPRRLLVLGGFTVLGWFALALFGATHASAAPTGDQPPATGVQLPLVSIPVDAIPVDTSALTSQPAAPKSPASRPGPSLTDTVAAVVAPARPTLDSLSRTLAPVAKPIARALPTPTRPAAAPAPTLTDATSSLLAQTGAALTQPAGSRPVLTTPLLLPALSDLLGGSHAIPAPPIPRDHTPTHSHPASGSTSAPSRVSHAGASGQPRSPSRTRPADESLSATPAPASAPHGPLAGSGIPAPLPALPPVGPDTVLGTGSGSTATSSTGSGSGLSSGYAIADVIRPDALLLGSAESARTRPVRNSATEPPVSPD